MVKILVNVGNIQNDYYAHDNAHDVMWQLLLYLREWFS